MKTPRIHCPTCDRDLANGEFTSHIEESFIENDKAFVVTAQCHGEYFTCSAPMEDIEALKPEDEYVIQLVDGTPLRGAH